MIRLLAASAVAGTALLVPSAPANAEICGGLENCPAYYLQLVLDTKAEAEATVEETRDRIPGYITVGPLPVKVCIPQNDIFSQTCVP